MQDRRSSYDRGWIVDVITVVGAWLKAGLVYVNFVWLVWQVLLCIIGKIAGWTGLRTWCGRIIGKISARLRSGATVGGQRGLSAANTETIVCLNLVLTIALFCAIPCLGTACPWLRCGIITYALLRTLAILTYQINVLFLDARRNVEKPPVNSALRSLILLLITFAEIVFLFAAIHLLFGHPLPLYASWSIMVSFGTSFGTGCTFEPTRCHLFLCWAQGMAGLIMLVLAVTITLGWLPPRPSRDPIELKLWKASDERAARTENGSPDISSK